MRQDQVKDRRSYRGYVQEPLRRDWCKSALPEGFATGGRPEPNRACPMRGHRAAHVSPLDHLASHKQNCVHLSRKGSRPVSISALFTARCAAATLIAILFVFALVLSPGLAQTTDFGVTTKTVTLPKGSKVDPRYLLRREKPADGDKAETEPEASPEEKLAQQLDARLLGAWTRVSSMSEELTSQNVRNAARRCAQQLKLKPLRFETSAARRLPDIEALFGDLVYYRTDKGLQRLDINSAQIRLVSEISARQIKNSQIVWTLMGQNLKLRIRFSNPLKNAPKARFMIEEYGFYLRCPSKDDDLFNDNQ
ncbi:MAG: hypothetical protein ABJL67_01135 [Sulfitobacter sp.]